MFDLLNQIERGAAAEAIYFAGLRIHERRHYPDWRRWLPLRPGDPAFPESLDAAAKLIEEVERHAGKPLAELSDAEVDPLWEQAREVMEARYGREVPSNPAVAERVLAELRRAYGDGYVHAAA